MNITKREKEVILQLTKGFTVKEVALRLFVAPSTIETHKKNIYRKFEARTMAQLGAMAVRRGIITILLLSMLFPGTNTAQMEIDGTIKASGLANPDGKNITASADGTLQLDNSDPSIWELRDSTGAIRFRFDANQGLFQVLNQGDTIQEIQTLEVPAQGSLQKPSKKTSKAITQERAEQIVQQVITILENVNPKIHGHFDSFIVQVPEVEFGITKFTHERPPLAGGKFTFVNSNNSRRTEYTVITDKNGEVTNLMVVDEDLAFPPFVETWDLSFLSGFLYEVSRKVETDVTPPGGNVTRKKVFDTSCDPIRASQDGTVSYDVINRPANETQTGHDGKDIFSVNSTTGASTFFNSTGLQSSTSPTSDRTYASPMGVGQSGDNTAPNTFGNLSKDKITFGDGEGVNHRQIEILPDPLNNRWIICGDVHIKGSATLEGTITENTTLPSRPRAKSDDKIERRKSIEGIAVTNNKGIAEVELPRYAMKSNAQVTYQLTTIGSFARAIIQKEIENGSFIIQSEEPNVKVSWQVSYIPEKTFNGQSENQNPQHYITPPLMSNPPNYLRQD